ncbi:Uncharacterized protein ChrSV_3868 [Chromobacterium vaccinii]|nr:Uncharacterized protein ChrSW_3868 [Chromobacterium vaccinii]QND91325.1 Uncharacterized protein ChrSV_3868 [Chromobacterium vaccinii]
MSEVTVTIDVSGDAGINRPPSQSTPAYDDKRNRLSIWAGGKWNRSKPLAAATVIDFGAVGDDATARNNQWDGFHAEALSVIHVPNPQTSGDKAQPSFVMESALLKFSKTDNLKN